MLRAVNNRLFAVAALFVQLCACESQTAPKPSPRIVFASKIPSPWPHAVLAAADALPRIINVWLSSSTIAPGSTLDGAIATTSNVASVEVRTAAFSINSSHVAPGQFRFHTRVLELPPLARLHTYTLDVIARNTAGQAQVEQALLAMK